MFRNLITLFLSLVISFACEARTVSMKQNVIQLPKPDKTVGMSLFDALQNRASQRQFSQREIDLGTLSQLLWAADGVTRPEEKKHTAPSAMNRQSITIFVCVKEGVYRYDPYSHSLVQVTTTDLRPAIKNGQPGTSDFPLALLMVGDNSKFDETQISSPMDMVVLDAAYISQNINLAATALGLNNVPRVNMNVDVIRQQLCISACQFPIVNNILGWAE